MTRPESHSKQDHMGGVSETMSFPSPVKRLSPMFWRLEAHLFATVHRQRVAKSPMSWRTGYYLRFGCAGNVRERSTKPA
jgi:hypothetical protein